MESPAQGSTRKPATAARIYDYYLGGIHNFPADQEAAKRIMEQLPSMPVVARANRSFLRRAVDNLVRLGVRQFLDIGSGIPTEGNVHEVAQAAAPDSRVVYVDIDPVAVAESLEILDGNGLATAIRGDLNNPPAILQHPEVRRMLDFNQPIGLLLAAVLHFVPDDEQAYGAVGQFVSEVPSDSYLVISQAAAESYAPTSDKTKAAIDVYRRQTTTSARSRDRAEVTRFFDGLELLPPGVVWLHEWRPGPGDAADFVDNPSYSGEWAAVGRKP